MLGALMGPCTVALLVSPPRLRGQRPSNTIRTARSRNSGGYLLGLGIGYILARNKPSDNPGPIQTDLSKASSLLRQRAKLGDRAAAVSGRHPSDAIVNWIIHDV